MRFSSEWKSTYSIGIEEIDHQHQYFLLLIQRIEKLSKEEADKKFISNTIEELVKYAQFHFKSEENLITAVRL